VTLNRKQGKNIKYLPFAFTEQGVAMLSAVLRSEIAIKVSIQIIQAFVALRKMVQDNQLIISRLDRIELKQLELDIRKANEQFGGFEAKVFDKSHDRFLIIDGKEIYHLGASLKDLGRKPVVSLSNHGLLFLGWRRIQLKVYWIQ
jgi:hypothetical protein